MKIVYLLQVMGLESLPYNKSGLRTVNFTRRSLRRYTVVSSFSAGVLTLVDVVWGCELEWAYV